MVLGWQKKRAVLNNTYMHTLMSLLACLLECLSTCLCAYLLTHLLTNLLAYFIIWHTHALSPSQWHATSFGQSPLNVKGRRIHQAWAQSMRDPSQLHIISGMSLQSRAMETICNSSLDIQPNMQQWQLPSHKVTRPQPPKTANQKEHSPSHATTQWHWHTCNHNQHAHSMHGSSNVATTTSTHMHDYKHSRPQSLSQEHTIVCIHRHGQDHTMPQSLHLQDQQSHNLHKSNGPQYASIDWG